MAPEDVARVVGDPRWYRTFLGLWCRTAIGAAALAADTLWFVLEPTDILTRASPIVPDPGVAIPAITGVLVLTLLFGWI